jgi:hypothetical protein
LTGVIFEHVKKNVDNDKHTEIENQRRFEPLTTALFFLPREIYKAYYERRVAQLVERHTSVEDRWRDRFESDAVSLIFYFTWHDTT